MAANIPNPDEIRKLIATVADIEREYGSVENFKHFFANVYIAQIMKMGDIILDKMGPLPSSILLLSQKLGAKNFNTLHLAIHPYTESSVTKKSIPFFLRRIIIHNYLPLVKEGEKIFGLINYSRGWVYTPSRVDVLFVLADFCFGGANVSFEILRPAPRPVNDDTPPPSRLKLLQGFEFSYEDGGLMWGLLRKTAGTFEETQNESL